MSASASSLMRAISALVLRRRLPVPLGLAGHLDQFVDRLDRGLHLLVAKTTAPSITSSGSSCASDSTISTAASVPATTRSSLEDSSHVRIRVQHVLAVDVADARRADRAVERDPRQRQRRRRAEHRGNVAVDFRIARHHLDDDLDFVVVALGEQRPDRSVDQPADQDLALGRATFTLEETPGNAPGGVELLDVVDRQREEVLARLGAPGAHHRRQHHGIVHRHQRRARRLPGDLAGLDGDGVAPPLERFLCDFEHFDSFQHCPRDHSGGAVRLSEVQNKRPARFACGSLVRCVIRADPVFRSAPCNSRGSCP